MKLFSISLLLLSLLSTASGAQECSSSTVVGNFEVRLDSATFDGTATKFTYCVTGLDNPGFRALSNWLVSLDPACIPADQVTGCGPEPCYYQELDPNLDLTGLKFDDTQVEVGQTVCYDFSLLGDWTVSLGDVEIGLKAARETYNGLICGPICCQAAMQVEWLPGRGISLRINLQHNIPTIVTTPVWYALRDVDGKILRSFQDGPVTFHNGDSYSRSAILPGSAGLAPGTYYVSARILGMNGFSSVTRKLVVTP